MTVDDHQLHSQIIWAWSPDPWASEIEAIIAVYLIGHRSARSAIADVKHFTDKFRAFGKQVLIEKESNYDNIERQRLHGVFNTVLDDIGFAGQVIRKTSHLPTTNGDRERAFGALLESRNNGTLGRLRSELIGR